MTRQHTNNQIQEKPNIFGKKWQPWEYKKAEWISNLAKESDALEKGPKAEIHIDLLRTILKKISNWKTPGHDGIHGFCFKKFTSIHERLALEMNRWLQGAHVPEWMTKRKTTLIQKDPLKGTSLINYRPITCLRRIWKIITAHIREDIYYSLTSRLLFPKEQKGCRKGSRDTEELLYIHQHILNESKTYLWPGLTSKKPMMCSHKAG